MILNLEADEKELRKLDVVFDRKDNKKVIS